MPTKIATVMAGGSANEALTLLIEHIRRDLAGQAPALVTVFASIRQPLAELLPGLQAAFPGAVVLGASTAGEFTEHGDDRDTVSALALAGDFQIHAGIAAGLQADVHGAVQRATAELPSTVAEYPHCTALLLLDPLSGCSEEATLSVALALGDQARLAGGAAGDNLNMVKTYVGLGDKVVTDGLVVAQLFSRAPLGVGVSHGHEPLSMPLVVTRAEGALVHEIDRRPAWDVWREHTRARAALQGVDPNRLAPSEVGGYLLRFEAGLEIGTDQYKIRAPLSATPEGALQFACAIPQGSTIRITETDIAPQHRSAREAARRALSNLGGAKAAGALVFDCACRKLVLGDGFKISVRAIAEELGNVPIAGFETYGEIALDVGELSGFHNTTTVVLAFPASE